MIHYWNKNNVLSYSNSIPQLLTLNQVAKSMLNYGVILDADHDISKSNDALSEIANKALFFKWETRLTGEIGQFVDILLDLIKASFLLEPILMFKIIKELDRKRIEIQHVFRTVAEVDVALSIDSFRDGLAYYTKPNISERKKSFSSEDIYHPLILNPVTNSLNISHGQSVLLSGSNMSGKTTFIRTIGINAILAQTINTACAKKFTIPKIKIHSAIRITDNLLDESSYYYEEVKAIKKLINESESEDQNLFLLDELFKGTNTVERISSGKAVLSYLNQNDNIVLAATHDLELTEFLRDSYKYLHFTETIENDKFSFDYKLKEGVLINTNAIRILEINDFPKQLTEEAKAIAKQFRNAKRNSNEG
jgi:DNA mismatch repair ATPase MutS